MPTKKKLKEYALDPKKVKRVQKTLGAKTETDAIEQALDAVLTDDKLERIHEAFLKSGLTLHDTLGR
jgi:hypothetical protein